jgi:hypothetical protein
MPAEKPKTETPFAVLVLSWQKTRLIKQASGQIFLPGHPVNTGQNWSELVLQQGKHHASILGR